MKKYLILFSFLLLNVSVVYGQDCYKPCLYRASIDSTKINIYTHLLQAKELKNENTLFLVDIQSNDLDIDFFTGTYFFINNITEKLDTLSVKKIKQKFPANVYHIYDEPCLEKYNEQRRQTELAYNRFKATALKHNPDYTYIRIFKPLDSWANLYLWLSYLENGAPYEIIPVFYVKMKGYEEIEKKYLLYKVTFSKEGKIESVNMIN
ncbi:hypothetical protein O2K51_07285 [Apibacter raozihei]|uniref:hypothetical protein n=1 Tax=Apibacter raozihei TaxID=2500547 RepID=UPI000FE3FAAF|nr:hypothetical protein [Apibacter raozihei]